MTFREAYSAIQGILGNRAGDELYDQAARLIKHATVEFASKTSASVVPLTISMNGSYDYTLPQVRVGRIWYATADDGSTVQRINGVNLTEHEARYGGPQSGATFPDIYTRFGRTLRVSPQPSAGTITLYHAPIPVLQLRDTPRDGFETCATGTTATAVATTISHGVINNRQGYTDYFNGCRFYGITTTESSFITGTIEGATLVTFSLSPYLGVTLVSHTFRIEDVLEVPDEYAPACIDYAAGMLCGLDKYGQVLAGRLLGSYDETLRRAAARPFGNGPDVESRIKDYSEGLMGEWR